MSRLYANTAIPYFQIRQPIHVKFDIRQDTTLQKTEIKHVTAFGEVPTKWSFLLFYIFPLVIYLFIKWNIHYHIT